MAFGIQRDLVIPIIGFLVVFSLGVYVLVFVGGFDRTPIDGIGYRTYFEKPNWWGYPFFFLLVTPAVWLSWKPFLAAWIRLKDTGVLRRSKGEVDAERLEGLEEAIAAKRWIAVALAFILAIVVNYIDTERMRRVFTAPTFSEQIELACRDPDFGTKWLFDVWTVKGFGGKPCTKPGAEESRGEPYFPEGFEGQRAPVLQILLTGSMYFQQFAITMLAALAFFQLLFHTVLFALFDRLRFARAHGLYLRLNAESPLHEFGLEHWNHALNNVYWAISPALLVPILSRVAQPDPSKLDPGQQMINIFIPVIVLAPMVATIVARQVKLPELWSQLQPQGPIDPEKYHRQRLWPLEKNWSSKLGLILAALLAGLVLGIEFSSLIRF